MDGVDSPIYFTIITIITWYFFVVVVVVVAVVRIVGEVNLHLRLSGMLMERLQKDFLVELDENNRLAHPSSLCNLLVL